MKCLHRIAAIVALALACAMPMAAPDAFAAESTLSVQVVNDNGLDITLSSANADGSKFLNPTDERTFLVCANSNGSTRTVTAESQTATVNVPGYGAVPTADQDSVVPATTGLTLIGPFPSARFNDSSGYAHVTYSATAGLTCGVAYLARPAP